MSLSMFESSIPRLLRNLNNLAGILGKAAAYAEERGIDDAVLVTARLFPDMLPLSAQVQVACDVSKGCGGRLSGTEAPSFEDNEATFDEL